MRRRPQQVLRSMRAGVSLAWNACMRLLGWMADAVRPEKVYAFWAVIVAVNLIGAYETRLDAAGFGWLPLTAYSMFSLVLALIAVGSGPFIRGQRGGGAMRTSPASA